MNKTPTATPEAVRAIIQERFNQEASERALVDQIRDIIATFEGKQFNARVLTKINRELDCLGTMDGRGTGVFGGHFTFHFWSGKTGRTFNNRLLLFLNSPDHHEFEGKSLTLKERFELSNPAHYRGADERQEKRKASLDSGLPEIYALAVETLKAAKARLEELTAYGEPLSADEYALRDSFIGK